MKQSEKNIIWMISKLQLLSGLDGFPRWKDQEAGLRGITMALLDIVNDQPEAWAEEYDPAQGQGVKRQTQAAVSAEETVDWLMARVLGSCERFPAPIQMRRIYETRYKCADGKLSGEVETK